jgi:hypothetical protein
MGNCLLLVIIIACSVLGCAARVELVGPPIPLTQVRSQGNNSFSRTRGIIEMYLTRSEPSFTFWNYPEQQRDAWGTVTLKTVEADGTVVVEFFGTKRARPGEAFPETGIHVIASNPGIGTALLRTRFTITAN